MKRLIPLSLPFLALGAWGVYGAVLAASQPKVEITRVESLAVNGEKNLPFYELMSPLPLADAGQVVPKLEYKKGPPNRFIERISLLLQGTPGNRERVVYYGRKTREDLKGVGILPESANREAEYMEMAVLASQGEPTGLPWWKEFALKPLLINEAKKWMSNVNRVAIMEQSGVPAFLFEGKGQSGGAKATALFVRRNSFYRIEYFADSSFHALSPEDHFRKSFLIERRADALEYLAKNLTEVKLQETQALEFKNIAWPILLLAANVSVDPSSMDAYFHFAGISALLYRSLSIGAGDTETLDILRNNVLASEFYARDVSPTSTQTAEIERLARLLTRNFEE